MDKTTPDVPAIPVAMLDDLEQGLNLISWTASVHPGGPLDTCLDAYKLMCEREMFNDAMFIRFECYGLEPALEKLLKADSSEWSTEIMVRVLYVLFMVCETYFSPPGSIFWFCNFFRETSHGCA